MTEPKMLSLFLAVTLFAGTANFAVWATKRFLLGRKGWIGLSDAILIYGGFLVVLAALGRTWR